MTHDEFRTRSLVIPTTPGRPLRVTQAVRFPEPPEDALTISAPIQGQRRRFWGPLRLAFDAVCAAAILTALWKVFS